MAKTQSELEDTSEEVEAGGGKVKVVANGAGDVIWTQVTKRLSILNNVEFLEEVVLGGVQGAIMTRQSPGSIQMDETPVGWVHRGCKAKVSVCGAIRPLQRSTPDTSMRAALSACHWRVRRRAFGVETLWNVLLPHHPSPMALVNANPLTPSDFIFSARRSHLRRHLHVYWKCAEAVVNGTPLLIASRIISSPGYCSFYRLSPTGGGQFVGDRANE